MPSTLETLSENFAAAVEAANPSVVRVDARRRLPASGIIWKEDRVIITANHVVQREDSIQVGLVDEEPVDAQLVGRDPSLDLAVLRVPSGVSTTQWNPEADMRVGHLVLALGRPGEDVMATHGIISAVGDGWRTRKQFMQGRLLQTDVVMYPGFSGGPLIDAQGALIGLNTSGLMRGVSISIPYETLDARIELLLKHGHIQRGFLGVSIQPVRLPTSFHKQFDQETGLMVAGVEDGSPADKGGIIQGDVLVQIDESPLRFPDELMSQLDMDRVGKKVAFQLIRGGEVLTLEATIGERR